MAKDYLWSELNVDFIRVVLVSVFILQIAHELHDLLLRPFFERVTLFILQVLVEKLVMEIEVAFGKDLKERFAIEVYVLVLLVGLVVDVGICEAELWRRYPLDMISPLHSLPAIVLTPWILMMSPHFIVYCSYDMQDISQIIKYNTLPTRITNTSFALGLSWFGQKADYPRGTINWLRKCLSMLFYELCSASMQQFVLAYILPFVLLLRVIWRYSHQFYITINNLSFLSLFVTNALLAFQLQI